jgi:hypothetical protein
MSNDNLDLFGGEASHPEWVGMPEFVQEKKEPFSQLIIRFETEADLSEFAEIIGQKLTPRTKSIWHPFKSHWRSERKVYVSES